MIHFFSWRMLLYNSVITSTTKFNEVYANLYAKLFLLRVRSITKYASQMRESSFSLPSAMHFHLCNSHEFTHIIGPHNFPNLFDKILIGRPRFRPEFPGPSWNTHRWKRNVAPLTSTNARRMEVGPTKRQELMECLLPRTPLLLL